jgi:hypothetical protein
MLTEMKDRALPVPSCTTTEPQAQRSLVKMIAPNRFKPFAGISQTVLLDSRGLIPDLRNAISNGLKLTRELQDQLFIIENLLEEAVD